MESKFVITFNLFVELLMPEYTFLFNCLVQTTCLFKIILYLNELKTLGVIRAFLLSWFLSFYIN
ncbi:hypothetical protein BpHYR1_010279 [Brachionus plicatilis]|uniref:Uncharacterized protein n=1 Tax=Brachionus plicatilis TaxID=10195 RepID=A0A3M7P7U7_BRAPC|nr:hypothetical protein BpHYR1_010279 [Brachionus plicatilis]